MALSWVSTMQMGKWMEVYSWWTRWHQELGWLFSCIHWFEVARGDFGLLGVVIAADSVCWITFSWWPVSCQPKSIFGSNGEWMTTVWTVCGAEHPKWMLMPKWQIIPWLLRRITDDDCSCGAAPLTVNISASIRWVYKEVTAKGQVQQVGSWAGKEKKLLGEFQDMLVIVLPVHLFALTPWSSFASLPCFWCSVWAFFIYSLNCKCSKCCPFCVAVSDTWCFQSRFQSFPLSIPAAKDQGAVLVHKGAECDHLGKFFPLQGICL